MALDNMPGRAQAAEVTVKKSGDAPAIQLVTVRPVRNGRRRLGVLLALSLLVVVGLLLTVLLARDERHLRLLQDYFFPASTRQDRAEQTISLRGRRIPPLTLRLPQRFLVVPPLLEQAVFLRYFHADGARFCTAMQKAGLGNGGWTAAAADASMFECVSETTEVALKPDADAPSFFMVVRGDSTGRIMQIRLKIVQPADSSDIRRRFEAALQLILDQTGWTDLADAMAEMRRLSPVSVNHFGIGLKMTKEFMGPQRYNVSMMLEDDGELDRRSRAILQARPTLSPPKKSLPVSLFRPLGSRPAR
ncbi:DUF6030 family protein [Allorhizobium undicola]|uniref:DUF6030 family protein n=1 Tax=Allorhizobium undicola TaxID=78527 RepID=UPI003D33CD50